MKQFTIIMFVFGLCIGTHGIVSLFCTNPYFNYLISGFMTAVLVYLIYVLEEKSKPLPPDCVKTPCRIVYRNGKKNTLYNLPYLDLKRSDNVWGFEIADITIYKEELTPSNWKMAQINSRASGTNKIKTRLPDLVEMLIIGSNMKKIDLTIKILKDNGVDADEFSFGKYWCAGVNLSYKLIPEVIYPRAGNLLKLFKSKYKPKNLQEVFYVRIVFTALMQE